MSDTDGEDDVFWDMQAVADYLQVQHNTVHVYRTRGELPDEDARFGRTPVWRPATIREWAASGRPGRGGGGGRPRKQQ